jgi:hypothetical protein
MCSNSTALGCQEKHNGVGSRIHDLLTPLQQRDEKKKIEIILTTLNGGTFTVCVDSSATLLELKSAICACKGYSKAWQTIFLEGGGESLRDCSKLSEEQSGARPLGLLLIIEATDSELIPPIQKHTTLFI